MKTTPEPVTVTVQGGQTEDQATTEAQDTTTEAAESGVPASATRSSAPAPTRARGSSDKRVGYVSFEVPKKARLRTFQFGTESGFGPEAGEWSLG